MVEEQGEPEDDSDGLQSPMARLLGEEHRERIKAAIEALPEREKLMITLYYQEELNLKEIGAVLGVSESRVCQLHSQAISRLGARLADRVHAEPAAGHKKTPGDESPGVLTSVRNGFSACRQRVWFATRALF
jgi:DNA-directed RNA polymerase specialized sigma24 family protein